MDAFTVKRRGRPATGLALSAAQRMQLKRQRDKPLLEDAQPAGDYSLIDTTALLGALSDAVAQNYYVVARKIAKELVTRSQL